MKIGYARISTKDQKLDLQTDALEKAGCEKIFTDVASGAKSQRPGLDEALNFARQKDVIVIWKLDRLGRSLKHLIQTVNDLSEREVGFESIEEKLDTTSASGKLLFHIFGALAEFERELIRERTNAELKAGRARGRNGGRPKSLRKPLEKIIIEKLEIKRRKVVIYIKVLINKKKGNSQKYCCSYLQNSRYYY
jgi:DNA invertase Pin-like site-specific DNA recombinase